MKSLDQRLIEQRDEALARAEAAERERDQIKAAKRAADGAFTLQREKLEAAERDGEKARNLWIDASNKLAAVRKICENPKVWLNDVDDERVGALVKADVILAILDGEGEKCPTCGGTDREGGTVATSGPDEFGNYETDDCEDEWHGEQK